MNSFEMGLHNPYIHCLHYVVQMIGFVHRYMCVLTIFQHSSLAEQWVGLTSSAVRFVRTKSRHELWVQVKNGATIGLLLRTLGCLLYLETLAKT